MRDRDNDDRPLPEGFKREKMTKAQEQVWCIAFANAMQSVRAPSAFYRAAELPDQIAHCEHLADFIAAHTPFKTLPSHEDNFCASRRPC